jgi:hypothetical protein
VYLTDERITLILKANQSFWTRIYTVPNVK